MKQKEQMISVHRDISFAAHNYRVAVIFFFFIVEGLVLARACDAGDGESCGWIEGDVQGVLI